MNILHSVRPLLLAPLAALLLAGCAGQAVRSTASTGTWTELPPREVDYTVATADPLARDRAAILAMAGDYHVRFNFDETVALEPGYALAEPKRSGATEFVTVVEQSPQRISLQHVLVIGEEHHVVKHWRQDWEYEPSHLLVFRGHRTWQKVALDPALTRGRWMQSVWEVDDAPRYAGLGQWEHHEGWSAWTSEPTNRPLPRRDYTTRDDYHLLRVANRHLLTPAGWVHEQDNTKIALGEDGSENPLVKEFGFNTYERIEGYDFTAGRDYWDQTRDFWAGVRQAWQARIAALPDGGLIAMHDEVDDKPLYRHMFDLAERVAAGETLEPGAIDDVLDRFSRPASEALAAVPSSARRADGY